MEFSDEDGLGRPLATRELFYEVVRRHDTPGQRQPVGDVSYGRWQVDRLPDTGRITDQPRPDQRQWELYLAKVPHSLRFLNAPRMVEVGFELTDATAYDLLPRAVDEPPRQPVEYRISAALCFTTDEGLPGSRHRVRCTRLSPITMSLGTGEERFSWRYLPPAGGDIPAGDRTGFVILQVPRGRTAIGVKAVSAVRAGRLRRGITDSYTFTLELPSASP
jgi:hypothetical protein